jgi:tetratricopeptide (TPR) repeat protein
LVEHPSRDELSAFFRGDLPAERSRALVRHLLSRCESCTVDLADLFRGEEETEYDAAIDRALHSMRDRKKGRAASRRKKTEEIEKIEDLLAKSWALRYEDPSEMVWYATLALKRAEKLDARKYGRERVLDLRGRATAELGNAYRVLEQLDAAEEKLDQAARILAVGTGEKELQMRLLELQASLAADRRLFGRACIYLSIVREHHRASGNQHLAGRAMIQQGLYVGYAGKPEQALQLLHEGLTLIDKEQEAELVYAAIHNQLHFIIDCGQFDEARKFRFLNSEVLSRDNGRVNRARLRELGGRIEAGLGKPERAEVIFREAKQEFEEIERPYLASIVALDLAAVLLAQSRPDEASAVVMQAHRVFKALRINREALTAVLILLHAIEMRQATAKMAEEVAAFFRRLERDPNARFDPEPL